MDKKAKIAAAGCACALAVGLGAVALKNSGGDKDKPTVETVVETTAAPAATEPAKIQDPGDWSKGLAYQPSASGLTERAKYYKNLNPDVVGWISVPGTQVDYPVMLDPGGIEDAPAFYGAGESYVPDSFYLDHDIDGSYLRCGSLFMDYKDVFGADEAEQSENIVIYGHNMANNTMFGSLRRYRQDYSFYDQSPFIRLSSNYKDYDYVIFACFITSGTFEGNDFVYWNMEELDTKEEFDFYTKRCKDIAMFDTGVDVEYGDKLLTLSTCYANEDNSRFLVVARRLRDGEKAGDVSSIARTEEWKKAKEKEKEQEKKEETT